MGFKLDVYSTALAPLLCIAVAEGTVHMLVVVIGGAVGHALRGTCELLLHALSMLPTFLLPIYIWNSHPPRISLPLFPVENIVSAAKTPGVFRTPEISCKSPPPPPFLSVSKFGKQQNASYCPKGNHFGGGKTNYQSGCVAQ